MAQERLRVLFVTEADPLYVIRFFEVFFAEVDRSRIEIAGITIDRAFREPLWKTARRMWRFYGPFGFTRMGFRFAGTKLKGRSIARLAEAHGVPIVPADSVNAPEYVARAKALEPDVIVSVAAPEIFKAPILGVPRLGCINVHSGRLPIYRGMMPNFWQMLHGERAARVTVHEMVEKLDAGGVLGTIDFPIQEKDSLDRVIVGTKREGARLVMRVLEQLRLGEARPDPLDMSDKKYFSFPKPEHVKEFRRRGHRLL